MRLLKRLVNEEKLFIKHNMAEKYDFFFNKEELNYTLSYTDEKRLGRVFIIDKKNNKILFFKIPQDYPFKPPYLYFYKNKEEIDYLTWNQKEGEKVKNLIDNKNINSYENYLIWFFAINYNINNLLYKPKIDHNLSIKCFCCDNLLCSNIWNPTTKLIDLINEFNIRKLYFCYFNMIKIYKIKYFYEIFHNNKWDLPEEIIYKIYEYL